MKEEINLTYPSNWENEYKATRFVASWRKTYPNLFVQHRGSSNPGTLDLFPQYALMFILRRDYGIYSITWYKMGGKKDLASTPKLIRNRWDIMRKRMGKERFDPLQRALRQAGLMGFKGEPDLFCWHPKSRNWFFAEAKGKDKVTESQRRWAEVCGQCLGKDADIRVYRLFPG